jgi:hypothetical protein
VVGSETASQTSACWLGESMLARKHRHGLVTCHRHPCPCSVPEVPICMFSSLSTALSPHASNTGPLECNVCSYTLATLLHPSMCLLSRACNTCCPQVLSQVVSYRSIVSVLTRLQHRSTIVSVPTHMNHLLSPGALPSLRPSCINIWHHQWPHQQQQQHCRCRTSRHL